MASWTDITPTILDWCGVKPAPVGKKDAPLPGRSLLPVLEKEKVDGWDMVFASHQFHEVTMYYPMRVVRSRTHKYILNLANGLEYPHASDLWASPTWQGILTRRDKLMGKREVKAYLNRPKEELYDLEKDPNELVNLLADPKWRENPANETTYTVHKNWLADWRKKTNDPWLVKDQHE
jgi:N-sulfoglucosamine sulfohydrolase